MQKPLVYLFKTYIKKKKKGSQFGEINGQEGEWGEMKSEDVEKNKVAF